MNDCFLLAMAQFQLVVGFVSFLILLCCDGATASFRAALVPVHATFGLVIFALGSATALTGLMQAARARLKYAFDTEFHSLHLIKTDKNNNN